MLTDDIKLDDELLYIKLRRYSWQALKAEGSERDIPLVDASLWVHKHVNLSLIDKRFDAWDHTLLDKTGQRYLDTA